MIPVRLATDADLEAVLGLAQRFHDEAAIGHALPGTLDPARLLALGRVGVAQGSLWVGAPDDGPPVGFLLALAVDNPFTGLLYGDEIAWWVAPEHRRGTLGVRLLVACIAWAEHNKLAYLTIASPAESPDVALFLLRSGFQVLETSYVLKGAA